METTKNNIKAIHNIHEYMKKIYESFFSLYNHFQNFHEELLSLQNELNFKSISPQMLDSYNKMILFLYERIKSILSMIFIGENAKEILILKPVRNNKYEQILELTYFTDDIITTKHLGNITTISINQINDEIIFLRGNMIFTFIIFDLSTQITKDDFMDHIDEYSKMTKQIINWIYSDIKSTKMFIKSLINIITELINLSPKKYALHWIELLENIKETLDEINKI
jgi:hypothetical protein